MLCPLSPEVYRFRFQEDSKKVASVKMPLSRKPYVPLRSLLSVALSCILHIGKVIVSVHWPFVKDG